MSWTVLFTRAAQKDARKLVSASPALKSKAQALLDLLTVDPYQNPHPSLGWRQGNQRFEELSTRQAAG